MRRLVNRTKSGIDCLIRRADRWRLPGVVALLQLTDQVASTEIASTLPGSFYIEHIKIKEIEVTLAIQDTVPVQIKEERLAPTEQARNIDGSRPV